MLHWIVILHYRLRPSVALLLWSSRGLLILFPVAVVPRNSAIRVMMIRRGVLRTSGVMLLGGIIGKSLMLLRHARLLRTETFVDLVVVVLADGGILVHGTLGATTAHSLRDHNHAATKLVDS